jgi:hypothetical protein
MNSFDDVAAISLTATMFALSFSVLAAIYYSVL